MRFVFVFRVLVCARVSRVFLPVSSVRFVCNWSSECSVCPRVRLCVPCVFPGSPRCLFTGVGRGERSTPAVDSGLAAVLAAVESVAVFVRVCRWVWMVVRFVRVIRVEPACARVSRVCPGSPRCLFTGTVQ